MAVNPDLKCNNADLTSAFQFIDPKMLGVITGSTTNVTLDLHNFFVPITRWSSTSIFLKPNETKRLEISNIQSLGERKEYYTFNLDPFFLTSPLVDTPVNLVITSNISSTLTFQSGIIVSDFVNNCNAAIRANQDLYDILYCEVSENNTIQIYSKDLDTSFQYELSFNVGSPNLYIPAVLSQSRIRYPNGRVKVLFLLIEYDETLPSNQKHIEYAYDDDYQINAENSLFRKFGKILFLTTDDDVEETDMNLSETVWLKNPQPFNITISAFIAS